MNFCSMTELFVNPRSEQHFIAVDAFDAQQQVNWPELLSDVTPLTAKRLNIDHKNETICCADSDFFACEWIFRSYLKRQHS
jgi:hypothetical protein